jgi:hypothetical protein
VFVRQVVAIESQSVDVELGLAEKVGE